MYSVLERAKEFELERAVMRGIPDLVTRIATLHSRSQELSPFWNIDFQANGDGVTIVFREKRPGSGNQDPIVFTPTYEFSPADPEATETQRRLVEALEYGDDVTVPGRFISRLDIGASDSIRSLFSLEPDGPIHSIRYGGAEVNDGLPLLARLEIVPRDQEDLILASVDFQFTERRMGSRGVKLRGQDASGFLNVTNKVISNGGRPSEGTFTFDLSSPANNWPYAMRSAAEFILGLKSGVRVNLRIGRARIGYCDVDDGPTHDMLMAARMIVAFDILQEYFGQQFPVPPETTYGDLRELEMLVELVQTGQANWLSSGFNATIRADRLEEMLSIPGVRTSRGAILTEYEEFGFEFGGNVFQLGHTRLHGQYMRLENLEELEAAIGTGISPQARWVCEDGEHIVVRRVEHAPATAP